MARHGAVPALLDRGAWNVRWRAPTVVGPNGRSVAHARTCRSALVPDHRSPWFWRVILRPPQEAERAARGDPRQSGNDVPVDAPVFVVVGGRFWRCAHFFAGPSG